MDGFGLEAEARMTTWHIMIPSDIEPDGGYSQDISEGNYLDLFSSFFLPTLPIAKQNCFLRDRDEHRNREGERERES